jgi:hypothetical protein
MKLNLKSLLPGFKLASGAVGLAMLALIAVATLARQVPPAPQANQASTRLRADAKIDQIVAKLERDVPQWMNEADVPGLSIALVR